MRSRQEHAGDASERPSGYLQPHPRDEYVLCATALIDGQVVLLGVGAARLDHDEPELELVIEPREAEDDVRRLLSGALTTAASAISRSRAA